MVHVEHLKDGLPIFKALSSEIRVEILELLSEYKQLNMNDIAEKLKLTNGAVTMHVKKLEECMDELHPYGNVRLKDVFEDMFKLYVANVSTSEIAKIYSRDVRTIEMIFKKFGMKRDKETKIQLDIHAVLSKYNINIEGLEKDLFEIYKK
jgi:DNA-binding transcriptional ArsR family regulator